MGILKSSLNPAKMGPDRKRNCTIAISIAENHMEENYSLPF